MSTNLLGVVFVGGITSYWYYGFRRTLLLARHRQEVLARLRREGRGAGERIVVAPLIAAAGHRKQSRDPRHHRGGQREQDGIPSAAACGTDATVRAPEPAPPSLVRSTAETLAKMAAAVGVSADELTAAGRDDAAGLLRSATRQQLGERHPGLGTLAGQLGQEASAQAELFPLVASGLDAIDASQLSARTRNQITGLFIGNLRHDAARRHHELLLMLRLAEEAIQVPPRQDT